MLHQIRVVLSHPTQSLSQVFSFLPVCMYHLHMNMQVHIELKHSHPITAPDKAPRNPLILRNLSQVHQVHKVHEVHQVHQLRVVLPPVILSSYAISLTGVFLPPSHESPCPVRKRSEVQLGVHTQALQKGSTGSTKGGQDHRRQAGPPINYV